MASAHYAKAINDIQEHYGISKPCALYLYHRAYRALRKDASYLPWNIKLQNALVMADKCIGIDWDKVMFGKEEENLRTHGINIDEISDVPFRWNENEDQENQEAEGHNSDSNVLDGWQVVSHKKKQKKLKKVNYSFTYVGLIP